MTTVLKSIARSDGTYVEIQQQVNVVYKTRPRVRIQRKVGYHVEVLRLCGAGYGCPTGDSSRYWFSSRRAAESYAKGLVK